MSTTLYRILRCGKAAKLLLWEQLNNCIKWLPSQISDSNVGNLNFKLWQVTRESTFVGAADPDHLTRGRECDLGAAESCEGTQQVQITWDILRSHWECYTM